MEKKNKMGRVDGREETNFSGERGKNGSRGLQGGRLLFLGSGGWEESCRCRKVGGIWEKDPLLSPSACSQWGTDQGTLCWPQESVSWNGHFQEDREPTRQPLKRGLSCSGLRVQ